MLEKVDLTKVLFLDIETVPAFPSFEQLPEKLKQLWDKKSTYFRADEETAEDVYQRAGIYAEFGKIVCISVGIAKVSDNSEVNGLRIKSFYDDDEKKLLVDFADMLNKFSGKKEVYLCAHNGKEFDFPYIARRMLVNGIPLPNVLNVPGKKPWDVPFLDTMELWKFGDYKHFTSLDLLTTIFDIPTPKEDIDGSMVGKVYWEDEDLNRIVKYCEKDVIALVQLFLRYRAQPLIDKNAVESVTVGLAF
ncbi:MAG: 3'-5' exonuclease [Bacteroidales bacterium]